jgi:hypothetical protein
VIAVYVLVAVVRKRLGIQASLYSFLQVLSLTSFEKMPILQAFADTIGEHEIAGSAKQPILFDL